MILRIEIYEPVTDEQIKAIKGVLAELGCTEITVELLPLEHEDGCECEICKEANIHVNPDLPIW